MKRQTMVNNSDFYCLNCGKRGIPIMRKMGKQKENNHRKKMYCPNCQLTVNHIEIRSFQDRLDFKEDFKNGLYEDEAKASIEYIKNENNVWNSLQGVIS